VGSAFANDGDVFVPQARASAATVQQAKPASDGRLLFSTRTAPQTNVYPLFGFAGLQGGEH
jgi:hypothetical protein